MFLRLLKIINWLLTKQKSVPIVEEPASEKITMKVKTEDIVSHIREWSLDRAADRNVPEDDARAILAEFYEWIEPEEEDIDIISLEADS